MLGNVLGDTVGSVYEFNNIYHKEFEFIGRDCYPTDDSICSVAVADWLLQKSDMAFTMRQWCQGYPSAGYGPMFRDWLENTDAGPYGSRGNGAPMRVGPIALWFKSAQAAYEAAVQATMITHNDPECYHAVKAVVALQRYAASGASMAELTRIAQQFYGDAVLTSLDVLRNRQGPHFDPFAKGTTVQAIVCFLHSTGVEDTIRNCISIGGDCDTSACIAGGIAEAYYGFPDEWYEPLMQRVPVEMREVIFTYYAKRALKPMTLDRTLLEIPFIDNQRRMPGL